VVISVRRYVFPIAGLVSLLVVSGASHNNVLAQPPARTTFQLEESSVSAIHRAFAAGQLTCVQLVRAYLRRIDAYDKNGPALTALITVNRNAEQTATELDRLYAGNRAAVRPLHCIPVVLKDNYDTADMPTTGGSVVLARSQPREDAFVVKRLKQAGALIIAKANLTELARGGNTVSSLGGQTKNPYDLDRTPGGSSGGTGAAIAANLGAIGTGSDTGQSVRSPASALALVGIRPTHGLVSRGGIIPLSLTQDEAGPITRTVEDAARTLDAMAGYDPADPVTAFGVHHTPRTYTSSLTADGLRNARIGVVEDMIGRDGVHQEVNAVFERATRKMTELGATLINVRIPNLEALSRGVTVSGFEGKTALNRYFAKLGPAAPVKTLQEFIAHGGFHPSLRNGLESDERVSDGLNDPEYKNRLLRREDFRRAIMSVIAEHRLDALLYPHQRRLVARIGEDQLERNGVLSSGTGFPAITIPGGFSPATASAPLGVPVGIELLGGDWSEATLIRLAYAFEQATHFRKPPQSTPPLR
jgi:Asp-tRNA(Asn)/Glu-tRNA(Gln) amidotransferase A subunit family amidase